MGCYNVACSVSNLSIGAGTKLAFIPLWPNQRSLQGPHILYPNTDLIYSHCIYYPVSLPIFGEYDDYGGVENIETDKNTDRIEKIFKMSIQKFVGFVTGRRGLTDMFGEEISMFSSPEKKKFLTSFQEEHKFGRKWLEIMGFENNGADRYFHPSSDKFYVEIYTARYIHKHTGVEKTETKDSFLIYNTDGIEQKKATYHDPDETFIKYWYELTEYIIYVSKEDQKIVKKLRKMSGMFVHREIYNELITRAKSGDMKIWYTKEHSPEKIYDKFLDDVKEYKNKEHRDAKLAEEIIKEDNLTGEAAKRLRRKLTFSFGHPLDSFSGSLIAHHFEGWPFFRDLYQDDLMDDMFKDEVINWIYFQAAIYCCNRFFFPGMNGEQHGNAWASKILAEKTIQIMEAEIYEYED